MPQAEFLVLMGVGGGFIILGLIGIFWGRREDRSYFDSLSGRSDLREFVEHWPVRSQSGALKLGGWLAMAIGLILLVAGIILWLLGGTPA